MQPGPLPSHQLLARVRRGLDSLDSQVTSSLHASAAASTASRALKSTHGVPVPFDMTVAVVKELSFSTSRCGPFDKAIALLREGADLGNKEQTGATFLEHDGPLTGRDRFVR